MAAAVEAVRGDCEAARGMLESWRRLPWWVQRRYPVETGTGAGSSASIGRRRLIAPRVAELDPEQALGKCGGEMHVESSPGGISPGELPASLRALAASVLRMFASDSRSRET